MIVWKLVLNKIVMIKFIYKYLLIINKFNINPYIYFVYIDVIPVIEVYSKDSLLFKIEFSE